MQAVMSASAKRFTIEKQSDPVEFFTWLLNTLHLGLTGNKRKKPSIITRCLQGELQITTEAGTGVLILRMCAVGPAVLCCKASKTASVTATRLEHMSAQWFP